MAAHVLRDLRKPGRTCRTFHMRHSVEKLRSSLIGLVEAASAVVRKNTCELLWLPWRGFPWAFPAAFWAPQLHNAPQLAIDSGQGRHGCLKIRIKCPSGIHAVLNLGMRQRESVRCNPKTFRTPEHHEKISQAKLATLFNLCSPYIAQ